MWKKKSKVENVLKGSLDSILSPSVKIQIMVVKVCFHLLSQVNFPAYDLNFH